MRGRRGRKPPEFYQLFPELRKDATALGSLIAAEPLVKPASKAVRNADRLAERIRAAPVAVRQIMLAMLDYAEGSSGMSNVVPEEAPGSTPLEQEVVTTSVQEAPVQHDPVYADPELDVRGVHEGGFVENDIVPEVSLAV